MRKLTDTQSKRKEICYENIRSTGKNNAAAGKRLVMFFLLPEEHGKDSGRQLLQYGMQHYGIEEDIVNEHDPKIAGFYAFNSPIPLDTDTFL
ncbi:hypothetical protein [Ruminococcus callidus]|uniref:hypothetical protein n=1 Tax=Ruminococcus callidus TaxID=40519 RepID=UPI0023F400AD|nr:hypothetical protein [Ruminococcus callidus]